jgi:signal transduction histidine kinase
VGDVGYRTRDTRLMLTSTSGDSPMRTLRSAAARHWSAIANDWTSYQTPPEESNVDHLVETLYRRVVFIVTLQGGILILVLAPLLDRTMAYQGVLYLAMSGLARVVKRRYGSRVSLVSAYSVSVVAGLAGIAVSGGIYSWIVMTLLMMSATLGFVIKLRNALLVWGGVLGSLCVMSALQAHDIWFPRVFSAGPGITAAHLTVGTITFTIPIFTSIQAYREALAQLETKVTELHAAEAETRKLLDGQSRFFWDVSHELRSPLTRLNLSLGKVRRDSGQETATSIERMENEVERLNTLIHQLLLLAQLKHGVQFPMHQQFDLATEVASVCDDAEFEANVAGRDLAFESSGPCPIEGCAELLRGALDNVIRNAIRFAPEGTAIEVQLSQPHAGLARIAVGDRGPGVPDAQIAMLFDPFFRVVPDGPAPVHRSGSGLGLAIAFEAVKKHDGRIAAENRSGGGLLVSLEVPTRVRDTANADRIDLHASSSD